MAAQAFQKVGRGGAGNFHDPADVTGPAKPRIDDIESQIVIQGKVNSINPNRPLPEYSHGGRGGAGNWYQPSAIFNSPPPSPNSHGETSKVRARYSGRGGAGNLKTAEAEIEERRKRNQEETHRFKEDIIRDVDLGLKPPEKAHLGEGRTIKD